MLDRAAHPDADWSLDPAGTPRENASVERLLGDVRLEHSIVDDG